MLYLSLGSNLGDRLSCLVQAVNRLKEYVFGVHFQCSSVYETPAWGNTNQQPFFNMVVAGSSNLDPETILFKVLEIEQALGRQRTEKWGPRTIDIDILLLDNQIINLDYLQVPHPYLHQRLFVLLPLIELAPQVQHPVVGKTMATLCAELPDETFSQVLSAPEFEKMLLK